MIRRLTLLMLTGLMALPLVPRSAHAQLKVVTSTTDLYDIAKSVGGDKITATHIGQNAPHWVMPSRVEVTCSAIQGRSGKNLRKWAREKSIRCNRW